MKLFAESDGIKIKQREDEASQACSCKSIDKEIKNKNEYSGVYERNGKLKAGFSKFKMFGCF